MTHFAEIKFDHTVLEVGTGSGYQAAILAQLVRKVCTVEIIPPLAEAAAESLRNLGYNNVSVKVGDGYQGWLECGPFNAIIVTAALEHVPPPLIEQLKVGGRLVMPLGPAHATQQLTVVEKIAASETKTRSIVLVRYPVSGLNAVSNTVRVERGPAGALATEHQPQDRQNFWSRLAVDRVAGRALVPIAEVHARVARAHLA
jgi:protein-L-isoaspartate(D-aspartate) O-methyltransferase